jgi:hypothetical protein
VLVVVEDGDVERVAQAFLDLEAAGGGDVLEVDPAVHRCEGDHGADDLVDVGGVQADRPGVDPGEPLEQRRLALHHRQRRGRADVAEPEHGGAVGDDRDGVALDGQPAGVLGLVGDRETDPGHPGRVGHREVVAGLQGHGRVHLELALQMHQERAVRHPVHVHTVDTLDRVADPIGVLRPAGVGRDVHRDRVGRGLHEVHRGDRAARLPDRGGDPPDRAGVVSRQQQPHRDRVGRVRAGHDKLRS